MILTLICKRSRYSRDGMYLLLFVESFYSFFSIGLNTINIIEGRAQNTAYMYLNSAYTGVAISSEATIAVISTVEIAPVLSRLKILIASIRRFIQI